tara:strand:+ start:45 stop:326 length:282 start_codon:yes stop_codon:yes gene_type:complete
MTAQTENVPYQYVTEVPRLLSFFVMCKAVITGRIHVNIIRENLVHTIDVGGEDGSALFRISCGISDEHIESLLHQYMLMATGGMDLGPDDLVH